LSFIKKLETGKELKHNRKHEEKQIAICCCVDGVLFFCSSVKVRGDGRRAWKRKSEQILGGGGGGGGEKRKVLEFGIIFFTESSKI